MNTLLGRVLVVLSVALAWITVPAQTLSDSKISLHLINGYTGGSSNVVSSRPRLLKVLAVDPNFPSGQLAAIRDFKTKAPTGKVIVRVYSPKTYWTNDNPTLSAADFWTNHMLPALNQLSGSDKALIDYLEGPNEGETPTLGYPYDANAPHLAAQWFNEFWTNLTPMMVSAGYKPCIGSIAVGNPGDVTDFDYFVPALRQAKAAGGSWSYHAYTIQYTTDVATEYWYSLRYRQVYAYFASNYPDLVTMPLVLTEGGVDDSGSPNLSGWQARGSSANYQRWLNWFDHQMQLDSYVVGCTLFQNGDPGGWASFDLETVMAGAQPGVVPITGWLANYLNNPTDFPAAPTGLSANAIGNKVQIAWTSIPTNPMTFNIKRSSVSGGPYTTLATGVAEGITNTSFMDTTAPANGLPSYYVVSAVTAFGEGANSAEVSATPSLPKINCGGSAVSAFSDDGFFDGGLTFAPTNSINTNGVVNPAPMAVYQSQRYGNLTYTIPNLPTNTSFKVRLHFAEVYYVFNSAGQRVFNVYLNGAKVLSNFDIWLAAGGQFKANVQEFNAVSDSAGKISVRLETVIDNASLNGLELMTGTTNSIPSAPTSLSAAVKSGNITLNWFVPDGATAFKVKRSTVNGGPYTVIASNVTAGIYVDTSYSQGTTYYYVVSAGNALGESGNSGQVSATPTNSLPDAIATALTWTNSAVASGAAVYFRVTVKNQGSTSIAANSLGIGFLVDGTQVSYVGAGNTALAAGSSATYTANGGGISGGGWIATLGNHTVTAVVDDINRFAEGNENNNLFSVPLTVSVSSYSINAGGSATGAFTADANFSGSTNTASTATAIDLTGASNAAPSAVYQTERWGPTKYNFGNLVSGKLYKTRLHFAEISASVTQAGDRRFNAFINTAQVLTNFDIVATAGSKFRAVSRQFNTAADGSGNILLHFARGAANEPKISGIEIFPYTNTAPVLSVIPTKTVNSGATLVFTNIATDADVPADILTFSVTNSPAGFTVNANGIVSWTAPQLTVTVTNSATVVVTDNGVPPLSNSKSFSIIVVAPPKLSSVVLTNGDVNLTWSTFPGKTYQIQFKPDLNATSWTDLGAATPAGGSTLSVTDSAPIDTQRFYRIVQLD